MTYSNMVISNVSGRTEFSVPFWKCLKCCIHVTHWAGLPRVPGELKICYYYYYYASK